MSAPVTVAGGSGSIAADFEELTAFAAALEAAAGSITGALGVLARCLADPALITAAALDPAGAAQVLALATVAIAGAGAAMAGCRSGAVGLNLAAAAYRGADELDRRVVPLLFAGYRLPGALLELTEHADSGIGAGIQAALTADPGIVDAGVQLLTVVGSAALPNPGGTVGLAGTLASPFRDGVAEVSAQPGMPTDDRSGPPRSATDLIRGLALRDLHDDGGGAIDVRILSSGGTRRVIVDITGTTEWNFDPRRRTPQASDMATNLRTLANQSSVYERGVVQALRRAGVRSNEPIMLVGHSQGGMIAARLAADLAAGSEFAVTHLITAGAPIGLAKVPGSVTVLSLQNRGDLVPELDGADNPRRTNWITVSLERGGNSVLARHSLQSYLAGAGDLDASADPSLLHWRATAAGFLAADAIRTQVFQVRRAR